MKQTSFKGEKIMKKNLLSIVAVLAFAVSCQTTNTEDYSDLHSDDESHNHSDHDFMESNEQQPSSFSAVSAMNAAKTDAPLLPQNATAGECFARVLVPAKYETEQVRMLKSESRELASVIPAKYRWTKKQILVKPESKKLVYGPA